MTVKLRLNENSLFIVEGNTSTHFFRKINNLSRPQLMLKYHLNNRQSGSQILYQLMKYSSEFRIALIMLSFILTKLNGYKEVVPINEA